MSDINFTRVASHAIRESITRNTLNLSDLCCPACGAHGPFRITAVCVLKVYGDGSYYAVGVKIDEAVPAGSCCECCECSHFGTVAAFRNKKGNQNGQ